MSDQFLATIASRALPYLASDSEEIDHIAVLRAAGLVMALVPDLGERGYLMNAIVLAITKEGRSRLAECGSVTRNAGVNDASHH